MKLLLCLLFSTLSIISIGQKFSIDLENSVVILKNPFSKIPIEEVVERNEKSKLFFDVKNNSILIKLPNNDSLKYYLTDQLEKTEGEKEFSFVSSCIHIMNNGKVDKGKIKLNLLNNKYTGDSKTVFIYENDSMILLFRGKNANVE